MQGREGTEQRWLWAFPTLLLSGGGHQEGQFLHRDDADSGCSYSTVEVGELRWVEVLRLRWVQMKEVREASGKWGGDPEVGYEGG